jgi:hypothetical protein
MQVSVKTNAKEVSRRIGKKGKELSASVRRALSITAQAGVGIIEDRTAKGRGFKGGFFKKYNPTYAAFRSKRGRGSTPDLQFTGKMLGSMTTKANSKQAVIFFTRAAEAKKAAMNNKSRPFFGFNRKEEKQLGQVFFRNVK